VAKLPDFQISPTPSAQAGVEELRSAYLHKANSIDQAMHAGEALSASVAHFGQDVAEVATTQEVAEAHKQFILGENEARRSIEGKVVFSTKDLEAQYGGRDKIPDAIKKQVGNLDKTYTDPDSEYYETRPREDLPAWAVAPELYRKKAMDAAQKAADNITFPGTKARFLAAATAQVDQGYTQHVIAAQEQLNAYQSAKVTIDSLRIADTGNLDAAMTHLQFAPRMDPVYKEKLVEQIQDHVAQYQLNKPMLAGDVVGMNNLVAGLQSGDTKFAYVNGQGVTEHVNAESLPEQTRRGLALEMQRYSQHLGNISREEADRQRHELNDRLTYDITQKYLNGDRAGILNTLHNPPPGTTGAELRSLVNQVTAWDQQLKKPDPEKTAQRNLATQSMYDALDDAANGNPDSTPNPFDPSKMIDPRTMNVTQAVTAGLLSPADAAKIRKKQNDLNSGKTMEPARQDVKDAENVVLNMLAMPETQDLPKQLQRANARANFRAALKGEEQSRGKRMSGDEIMDWATRWAANGNTKDTHWFGPDTFVTNPVLADLPRADYAYPLQQAMAAYPEADRTAVGVASVWKEHVQPWVNPVRSAYSVTSMAASKQPLTPMDEVKYATSIDKSKEGLKSTLFNKYGIKNPTDEQVALLYFQNMNKLNKAAFSAR
jgi:hypothetical protein